MLLVLAMVAGCTAPQGLAPVAERTEVAEERAFTFDVTPSATVGGSQLVVRGFELLPEYPENLSQVEVAISVMPAPTPGVTNTFQLFDDRVIYAETSVPQADGLYRMSVNATTYFREQLNLAYSPPAEGPGGSTAARLDVVVLIVTLVDS